MMFDLTSLLLIAGSNAPVVDGVAGALKATTDAPLELRFNWMGWTIVGLYVILTTWFGHFMSGKQATIRDFFLGGRKLPWWAVSGSIIATEISAMTLVGVPAFLWADKGDMSYLVLAIGGIVSRVIVAMVFIPVFYEREIYSPYEYIGNMLGERQRKLTSYLFMTGGALGQGTRVLLTAMVLRALIPSLGDSSVGIHVAIWVVGIFAVLWTFMGGIVTVIWTDVLQFLIFLFSAIVALVIIVMEVNAAGTSTAQMIDTAAQAGKFHWLNFDLNLSMNYTIWSAVIASSLGGLYSYGTDQLMVQRCFCCKNISDARKALIWSCVGQAVMVVCLLAGVALWYYYKVANLGSVQEVDSINKTTNNVLPMFIAYRMHPIIGGIVVAGIFAAAISSLEGILGALSEQTLAAFRNSGRLKEKSEADHIRFSRYAIFVWGFVLCLMASAFWEVWQGQGLIIELALSIVGLTGGAILGIFFVALVPSWRKRAAVLPWAAGLSLLAVFAFQAKPAWGTADSNYWCLAVMGLGLLTIVATAASKLRNTVPALLICLVFGALALAAYWVRISVFTKTLQLGFPFDLGWPWFAPLGFLVLLASSALLATTEKSEEPVPAVAPAHS